MQSYFVWSLFYLSSLNWRIVNFGFLIMCFMLAFAYLALYMVSGMFFYVNITIDINWKSYSLSVINEIVWFHFNVLFRVHCLMFLWFLFHVFLEILMCFCLYSHKLNWIGRFLIANCLDNLGSYSTNFCSMYSFTLTLS